ncbi:hypothetical protein LINPERHAP1_LOCUS43038 [Linum perenne]
MIASLRSYPSHPLEMLAMPPSSHLRFGCQLIQTLSGRGSYRQIIQRSCREWI